MARSWAPLPPPKRGPIACDWAGHSHRDTLWKESLKPFLTNNTGIIHPCNSTCLQTHTPHTTCVQVHTHTRTVHIHTCALRPVFKRSQPMCDLRPTLSPILRHTHKDSPHSHAASHSCTHHPRQCEQQYTSSHTHTPLMCSYTPWLLLIHTSCTHIYIFYSSLVIMLS